MTIGERTVVPGTTERVSEEGGFPDVIQAKPRKKWTTYLWDTLDKSPEERRFVFKIDAAILTFASLGKLCLTILI